MQARLYPGWRIVAAAAIGMACCTVPLIMASFGLFVRPLSAEFGWSRAEVSGAISAHTLASIFAAPIAGAIVDRFGARPVIIVSFLLFAAALAGHAWMSDDTTHLYGLYALTAIAGAGCSPVAYTKVVAQWFNRRRGLALGVALSGVGVGAALTPLILQPILEAHGWRQAYLTLALAPLLIGAPSALFLLHGAPSKLDAAHADKEGVGGNAPNFGMAFMDAIKTRAFITLGLAFCLVGIGYTGVASHLIPSLQDRGAPGALAAQMQAAIGIAVIFGRLCTGFLMDRFPARFVAAGATSLLVVGVGLLLNAPIGPWLWLGAVLLGFAAGAEIDVLAYMTGRYFGPARFASLYGSLQSCYSLGVAIGPPMVGMICDEFNSYQPATSIVGPVLLAALVLLLLLPKPTSPAAHHA